MSQVVSLFHFEAGEHTVSASGELVEAHGTLKTHGHDAPSVCDVGDTAEWVEAQRCSGGVEVSVHQGADVIPVVPHIDTALTGFSDRVSHRLKVWLVAPKASPPT